MDMGLYRKCIADLGRFGEKVKVLRFVGMGEPLLHKNIVAMIECAVAGQVAERVEILTNAFLLAEPLSLALVDAGLSRLIISVQGTNSQKYREVCGVDLDFDRFIENIRFFYAHRGKTQIHIKIIDCALDGAEDEQQFYELFGDICDSIGVENVGPIYPWVDYGNILGEKQKNVTQFGLAAADLNVCPQPFFTLQINPDGKVVPCYSIDYPCIVGDCSKESLYDIWHGMALQGFRCGMLDGIRHASAACASCLIIKHRVFPEDVLDNDVARLRRIYGCEERERA